MKPARSSGRFFPTLAILSLCVCAVCAGCRRVETPPAPREAAELRADAAVALEQGRAEDAAELLARAILADDNAERGIEAALMLAEAGRLDLARSFVAEGDEPPVAALREALQYLEGVPGRPENPGPVIVMPFADGFRALAAAPMVLEELERPLRFDADSLALLTRTWQAWTRLDALRVEPTGAQTLPAVDGRRSLLSGSAEPAEPAVVENGKGLLRRDPSRVLLGWLLPAPPGWAPALFICQPMGRGDNAFVLAHMGSWPLSGANVPAELLALADGKVGRPNESVGVLMAAWRADTDLARLLLAGYRDEEGFVAEAVGDPGRFVHMLAAMTDPDFADDAIRCRSAAERDEMLALAERLGRSEELQTSDLTLRITPAAETSTDFEVDTRWLADLAGYVRYALADGRLPPVD